MDNFCIPRDVYVLVATCTMKIGVTKVSIKLVKIPLNTGDKHSVGYYSHSVDKCTFIILMDLSIVIIYVEIINWS